MEINKKTIYKPEDEQFLRQRSEEVSFKKKEHKDIIKTLKEFCLTNPCMAVSAVQLGQAKRIIYVRCTDPNIDLTNEENKYYNEKKVFINPVPVTMKGETQSWETCVSCKGYAYLVKRPYEMVVDYYDEKGELQSEIFEGYEASILASEIDHLDGILPLDLVLGNEQEPGDDFRVVNEKRLEQLRTQQPYKVLSTTSDFKSNKGSARKRTIKK